MFGLSVTIDYIDVIAQYDVYEIHITCLYHVYNYIDIYTKLTEYCPDTLSQRKGSLQLYMLPTKRVHAVTVVQTRSFFGKEHDPIKSHQSIQTFDS